MSEQTKLKPCPFCGSVLLKTLRSGNVCFVQCESCECDGPIERPIIGASSDRRAEEAWNRRHAPALSCFWECDEDGFYHSGCGFSWAATDGNSPEENGHSFCPKCGGIITSIDQIPDGIEVASVHEDSSDV